MATEIYLHRRYDVLGVLGPFVLSFGRVVHRVALFPRHTPNYATQTLVLWPRITEIVIDTHYSHIE